MIDFNTSESRPAKRIIRVFVSSTFRDMQAEREELIKRTFPQLRKLCESRSVTWSEVDLRWGVTDEQRAEGQVLPICLAEVRRCRPYFIGLLGDRYGWIPDDIDPGTLTQEPWLGEYRGSSLTELEIVCGVLKNPEMADHAFFYFRGLSSDGGAATSEQVSAESVRKLASLKDRIRASRFPVRENYQSAPELGALVLADFTRLIDRLFPEGSAPDPLDREAAMHAIYADSRAHVYVAKQELFDLLDAHVRGDGLPLVVIGESGLGKSALLANWILHYRAAHPDHFTFTHFLGASSASTDWAALVRRLLGEFNRRFGLSLSIPDQPESLRTALADGLRTVASMHRVVIVLDGLNQLDDHDQAPDLGWLPRDLLSRVRLVVSTLPGRAFDEVERRGWPKLQLAPLTEEEKRRLIKEYLAQYTKALARSQAELIAASPLSGNPLFLTALLEELRVWGEHETLERPIRRYLSVSTLSELFQAILDRYESDYERERPNLVRDAMTAIWAARHGISEVELFDLLGESGQPRRAWSMLYLAAERSLVSHAGLLGFFHDYLRQAVRDRYLPTAEAQHDAHMRLADYFSLRELSQRKVAELPWQLAQAKEWQRLRDLLADLSFVHAAWAGNGAEVRGYWSRVMQHIPDALMQAYQPAFDDPNNKKNMQYLYLLSLLLALLDHAKESLQLQHSLIDLFGRMAEDHLEIDPQAFGQLLMDAAANYLNLDEFDHALEMSRIAQQVGQAHGNQWCLAAGLGMEATVLMERDKGGDTAEAETLFSRAEDLWRALGNKQALANVLTNHATIIARYDPARALDLLTEQERIARDLGNQDCLSDCLGNQGRILRELGQFDRALQKQTENENLCRETGDAQGLHLALFNKACTLQAVGHNSESLPLLQEAEAISRRRGKTQDVATYLIFQAHAREADGQRVQAIQLLKNAETLFREMGKVDSAVRVMFDQARIYAEHLRKPAMAVPGMRAAQQLAEANGLDDLAQHIKRLVDKYQSLPP